MKEIYLLGILGIILCIVLLAGGCVTTSTSTSTPTPTPPPAAAPPLDAGYPDALVVTNTIPINMAMGREYQAYITTKNTGTKAWTEADGFRLGAVEESGNKASMFGPTRLYLPSGVRVNPGQNYTWLFTLKAPMTPGSYTIKYRMVWENHKWFGATASKTISVKAGTNI